MANVKWQIVCSCCGKAGGPIKVASDTTGVPAGPAPNCMAGKCPSSPNGKHQPRWEKV